MSGKSYNIIIEVLAVPSSTIATYDMQATTQTGSYGQPLLSSIINTTTNTNSLSVLQSIQEYNTPISGYGYTTNEFNEAISSFVMNELNLLSTVIVDTELSSALNDENYATSSTHEYNFVYWSNELVPMNQIEYYNTSSYTFDLIAAKDGNPAFNIDITSVEATSPKGIDYAAARDYYYRAMSNRKTITAIFVGRSANAYGDVILSPVIYVNGETYDVKSTKPHACAYTAITEVVIPLSYELIGRDSFRDCSKLTKIIFLGVRTTSTNPIVIEKNAFLNLPTKLNSSTPLTLYTSPLSRNNPVYDYFYKLYGDTINYSETPCFKEDTKILTDKGYVAIQDLRKGDMVKTLHDDYKAIAMIGSEEIHHNSKDERNRNQLFKYSSTNHPEVFEDLVITGGHSVLVDSLHENEEKESKQWINECDMKVDNKCRLLAFIDETCYIYEVDGPHTIYHFALEGDYHKNYGVYANGLLVEACSQYYLKEHSCMSLME